MSHFDLVIFDCDGTLVDSEELNNVSTAEILADIGLARYTPDYNMANFIGKSQPEIWAIIEQDAGQALPADINDRYIARIRHNRDQYLQPAPDALFVVEQVSKTHKICVASNGERENVISAMENTGLARFFTSETIYTAIQVKHPKPAPDLFLLAAEMAGVKPERTLVIEDSLVGARAGLAAEMSVYGYTGLSHPKDEQARKLQSLGVHHVFDSLTGILDVLNPAAAA